MRRNSSLKLTNREVGEMFAEAESSKIFPPILDVGQAAALASVTPATVYDWSSRGLLGNCAVKKGKKLRIIRDRFIRFLFEDEEGK